MKLTIDFETRSPVELKASGAWRYAEHPDTDAMCLAVKVDEQPTRIWINPRFGRWPALPTISAEEVFELIQRAEQIEAHNAFFERAIWVNVLVPRYNWPEIPQHKWRCSAAKVAAFALPRSLDGAGRALNLSIRKDKEGHNLMLKLCRPRKPPTPLQLLKEWKREGMEWLAQDPVQGAVIEISKAGGIDEKLLLKDYDKDTVRELKAGRRGFIRVGGRLPPDQAAADHGFESLDAMVEAVRASKSPAKSLDSYVEYLEQEWQYTQVKDGESLLWHEDPADLKRLFQYCIQDVEAEHVLSKAIPDLNAFEQRIWHLDQTINVRGILADVPAARAIQQVIEIHEEKLLSEVPKLSNGVLDSVRQVAALAEFCNMIDGTKSSVETALAGDLPPDIRRLLEIRQSLGRSSTSKISTIINRACRDGRLRGEMIYQGASTGRWTGSGFQAQNLPRAKVSDAEVEPALATFESGFNRVALLYGDVTDIAKKLIRPLLRASPGMDLISADFASIEARVLLWLAGDEAGLEAFRLGQDIYLDMASAIYERPCTKADKAERQLGKTAVLALGFSMGAVKFRDTCKGFGIEIDKSLARKAVRIYRQRYEKVVKLWRQVESAAIHAVKTGQQVSVGPVRFGMRKDFLHIMLPSRRLLTYPSPRLKTESAFLFPTIDEDGITGWIMVTGTGNVRATAEKRAFDEGVEITGPAQERERVSLSYAGMVRGQWTRESTYSGKLVENVVQATARDLLANAMLRVEKAGYNLVLTVHDEIVSEIPEGFGSVKEYEDLMSETPPWAEGLPVSAEGWRGKRYRKG